ncbi:MAG TPA: glycosyltransferase [Spirosoma sp.]|jgi:glycosyltransferase involved in cell wall biosynthesis|nr:glycosyltransferase [Spirosoma sp.]
MKIALVQDGLMCRAGGEQVALCFHKAFPDAPIYTLCYQPDLTFSEFKDCQIFTSWLQGITKSDKAMKLLFFPLGIWAMQAQDLTAYDVVLMSSTHCAKYVKMRPDSLVINYCHTPFRIAWNPMSYAQYAQAGSLKRKVIDQVLRILRRIDFRAGQRPDVYLANTEETAQRARESYQLRKPVTVLYPPVNSKNFYVNDKPKNYFLIVSRLEYYKKVDLVVEAFNQLGYPLVIVGKGINEAQIKARARHNITFMSGLSAEELAKVYAGCRAFICPQHEDYGIAPLEANAAGRPVIAYGKGGVLATQIPVDQDASQATALFFADQTVASLTDAIDRFIGLEHEFDAHFIRRHAEEFDEALFIERIQLLVQEKYMAFKKPAIA